MKEDVHICTVFKIIKMKKSEAIDLIKGEFTPNEATEILISIIGDKIKFNNRQIFSHEERNSGDVERYKKRLKELKEPQQGALLFIEQARKQNKQVNIDAIININMN